MKNFLLIVIAALLFAGCKNESGKFTVTGKIKNAPADSVYLEKLSYNSADSKTIDSAKIDKDGNYKLSGADTQQNLYMLSFKNSPAVILVNDAGKINIDFDLKGAVYPDINGSAATKELYDFLKDFWQKDSLLSDNYYKLDSMNKNGIKDSVYAMQLQQQYVKQIGALGSAIQGFVKKSNNPAAICFVLDKARGAVSPDDLNALVQDASKRFPEHSGIAIFKSEIAQAMQSQSQANSAASALLNQPAPDLTMTDANGKKISISDFKGKYLLVDFWASWCGPCRQENPNVVAAYNKFKNKNFTILGVSLDEDKAAWMKAVKDDHLAWTQMSDLKQWESAAISTYHFDGIPFNVLIDPQGKVIAESLRGEELEQKLNEVLQ
jgi:peroxiredoxin